MTYMSSTKDRFLVSKIQMQFCIFLFSVYKHDVAVNQDQLDLKCYPCHRRVFTFTLSTFNIVMHCIALHCIVLNCIVLHCIALYCIVLYCIVLYLFIS